MRTVQLINSICLLALSACAHTPDSSPVKTEKFRFIFLEIGKKTPDDKALVGQMQRGHIDNFKRLFAEQKLIVAGPPQDPSTLKRGIVIVNRCALNVWGAFVRRAPATGQPAATVFR